MNDSSRIRESRVYSFGRFRFFPSGGQLIDGDVPVRLGSRAAEILAALVENAGKVVSHDQLIARAWPDTHVEEGNLRVHISALNKAFRQGRDKRRYITNVPGRGYRFDEMTFPDTEGKSRTESRSIQDEPMSAARIFGRDECITNVAHEIGRNRFVTIVGAGGIGKTTVASAVARKIAESYERVLILDLAPLREQKNVVRKLASLLGIADLKDDLMTAALRAISDRKILIVIDNCEHLIEAAAVLAERLFMECAGTAVLCTSREPLRAIGEYVRRIEPLETPDTSESMSAAEALSYPAVALFVERASEASDWFEFRDTDVAPVVNVCRRLDGLALGIEIAAARAGVLGIQGLSEQLEDMLGLLTSGRRTSLPRHQTISSMLDWSYGLLPPEERMLLTRFSAFVGPVALETVKGVVASKELPAPLIAGLLANLANKSLLMIDTSGPTIRYRLLETTKDYALQKLQEAGESEKLRRRHAEFYLERFIRANRELLETPAQSWIAEYAVCVDNVRLAIDWAFSSKDDEQLGIALTAAASPLLLRLMLYGECRSRVEESLQRFTLTEQSADAREMYLYGALGSSLLLTIGSGPEMLKAWQSAYEIAERVADTDFQLRALCGVWLGSLSIGRHTDAMRSARQAMAVATDHGKPEDASAGARMEATLCCLSGELERARDLSDNALALYRPSNSQLVRFQFDQKVATQCLLANILWLQGFGNDALDYARRALSHAQAIAHAPSQFYAVINGAYPMSIHANDRMLERQCRQILESFTSAHTTWGIWINCFRGLSMIRDGDPRSGVGFLRAGMAMFPHSALSLRRIPFQVGLIEGLIQSGERAEASKLLAETLRYCEDSGERWYMPELLRFEAEALIAEDADSAAITSKLEQSLAEAQKMGARTWETRTALTTAEYVRLHQCPTDIETTPFELENDPARRRGLRKSPLIQT